MHRQFITYQGRPLVVGEEDDILTIPEPGIEVNEILGSAEVTEKIAEDVQVGDLIYKKLASFDPNKSIPPTGTTRGHRFVIHKQELYCVVSTVDYNQYIIYKYVNDVWELHTGPFPHFTNGWYLANESNTGLSVLSTSDDKLLASHINNFRYAPGFSVNEIVGNELKHYFNYEPSSFPDVRYASPGNWASVYGTKLYEASGTVHLGVCYESELSGMGLSVYTVDTSNGIISGVPIDASGPYKAFDLDIIEYQNELYLVLANANTGSDQLTVFKYNPALHRWDFHHYGENQSSNINQLRLHVTDSGMWCVATRGTSPFTTVWKFNDSTQEFETYFNFSDLGADALGNYGRSIDMFDHSGIEYIINPASQQVTDFNDGRDIYLVKHDSSTSSFSKIEYGVSGTRFANQTNLYSVDTITFNGETHLALSYLYGEQLTFFKWDPVNEKFIRNVKWQAIANNQRLHFIEHYNYNGTTYAAQGNAAGLRINFATFTTDGDVSGYYDHMKHPDVAIVNEYYDAKFYELSGNLQCIGVNRSSPYFTRWQLDSSANQFKKLADPSSTPPGIVWGIETAELSGVRYFALGCFSSPYILTYYLDGSTLVNIPDPSGLPSRTINTLDLKEYQNNLYLIGSQYNLNGAAMLAWKFNGSVWEDVNVTQLIHNYSNISMSQSCKMFELDNELYAIDSHNHPNFLRVYKYLDSSGWVEQPDMEPYGQRGGLNDSCEVVIHKGDLYAFYSGQMSQYKSACYAMKRTSSTGKWELLPVQPQSEGNPESIGAYSVNGELWAYTGRFNIMQKTQSYKLSDFAGEEVWYKDVDYDTPTLKYSATGIALESGSKGDTIRIQKVRR